jgi:hypothetical protein
MGVKLLHSLTSISATPGRPLTVTATTVQGCHPATAHPGGLMMRSALMVKSRLVAFCALQGAPTPHASQLVEPGVMIRDLLGKYEELSKNSPD